jgi:hypothetical protein
MRTYTIAPASPTRLRTAASVFVGAFGTIWLFIEPLGLFGLIPPVGGLLGVASYLLILVAAFLILLLVLRSYRWYKIHDLPFVVLKVVAASDGVTYSLRVAKNMQVGDFLYEFIHLLSRGPGREKVRMFSRRYDPVLQVKRDAKLIDIDSNLTIGGAGLLDGETCQVRGEENARFNTPLFSIAPEHSHESADL